MAGSLKGKYLEPYDHNLYKFGKLHRAREDWLINIHSEARTPPKTRKDIHDNKGRMTLDEAAAHFNVSRATILKWRNRESFEDRFHHPHQIKTALTPIQEAVVVELRRTLLLCVDDLLMVCNEQFLDDYSTNSPVIIFEVLSKATRQADRKQKLFEYLQLPSLLEYVLIEQDSIEVEVLRCSQNWRPDYYY